MRRLQVTFPQTGQPVLSSLFVIAFIDAENIGEEANELNNIAVSAPIP